jgi:L-alanine-DL-glutamate epimerase-like enolase superfamily enzyme
MAADTKPGGRHEDHRVEPFILHVPVTGSQIADSTHTSRTGAWSGARIDTDSGLSGYGFTGTHAHLPGDQLITRCIATCHAPLLVGEDARDVQRLWLKLARNPRCSGSAAPASPRWRRPRSTSRCGTSRPRRGRAAVEAAGRPVREQVRAYNTDIGWLSIADDKLVKGARARWKQGFTGIKIKVGPRWNATCAGCGGARRDRPEVTLAVDGNGKWDLADLPALLPRRRSARRVLVRGAALVRRREGPRRAGARHPHPVALGEQLYTQDAFAEFFHQQAIHWVQPDVTRMAG